MKIVFPLNHVRELDEDSNEVKFIGVYSSEEEARAAIARLSGQPGFKDYPDGFEFEPYEIDTDHWTEGFVIGDYA